MDSFPIVFSGVTIIIIRDNKKIRKKRKMNKIQI